MAHLNLKFKTLICVSRVWLCFSVMCTAVAADDDDGAFMSKLAKALSPTPSGWSGSSFCNWSGVKCSVNKRVIAINLASRELSGTLPPNLSSLSQLTSLSLQGNALSGALPSLAKLFMLESVVLDGNNFTSIPDGCFQGLTSLQSLSKKDNMNLAPWTIPTELTQSLNLIKLDLGNSNLVGSLPDVFDSFVSLQELGLSYNNLTGGLPKSFAGSVIQNLWLNTQNREFRFSGSIEVLSSMTHLSQVWLQNNRFTGPIPDLSNCTSLFDLQLMDNQLTGVVPPSLMSLPSLKNVSLDYNVFQGPVPSFRKSVKATFGGVNGFCHKNAGPCDPQVTTLLDIARDFGYPLQLADSWIGNDPCEVWSFIVCAEENIITVNLANLNLTGTISPAFANLTYLRNLYLFHNNLVGSIPWSLTNLAQLKVLDVSNNNLSGDVPKFSTNVKFNASGNDLLGRFGAADPRILRTSSGSSLSPAWIKGIISIAVFFVAVVVLAFCMNHDIIHRGKFGKVNNLEDRKGVVQSFKMSIQVLWQATNSFSEDKILGRGGFGVVYRGEFHDGSKIAVKRMRPGAMGSKGMNQFQAEISFLSKVRHKHLVALLGYCINGNERLLVYEYMPQGTLTQHLFHWRENGCVPLTWKQRVTIALDVARGVEYLHTLAHQTFIHRDLKPSNILLGDDMRAKVADFGLVKNAPHEKESVETRVAGTFGYLAPEYASTGRVTTKVDVYAFGIVLMELITGRKALDNTVPEEMCHLVSWFRNKILINMENMTVATDQTLNPDEETMEGIYKVAELAGHCTATEPHQRPDMGHAVNVLVPLVEQWNPTACSHDEEKEEECYEMVNEGTMSFSEIQLGR